MGRVGVWRGREVNVIGSEGWWAVESEEGGGKGVDHN